MAKPRAGRKLVQFEATEELIARADAAAERELLKANGAPNRERRIASRAEAGRATTWGCRCQSAPFALRSVNRKNWVDVNSKKRPGMGSRASLPFYMIR